MTDDTAREVFDAVGVRMSPDTPGVYVLFHDARTIYVGMTDKSLRSALRSHERGDQGALTNHATSYWCEPSVGTDAAARQLELLDAYRTVHNMNVPIGNRYPERVALSARPGSAKR
jgi:hypothetical protein